MTTRPEALAAIARIAQEHGLTASEVYEALAREPRPAPPRNAVSRVLGSLGWTFLFAGLCTFVGMQWESMNSAARVVITLGPGLTAFALAHLALPTQRHARLWVPLFLTAMLLVPAGMLVAFAEFSRGGEPRVAVLVTAATVAFACAASLKATRRTLALFGVLFFGTAALATALDLLGVSEDATALTLGTALFLVTVAVDRSRHRALAPLWYLGSSGAVLTAWFDLVQDTAVELTFVALACLVVFLSTVLRSRTLLVAGVLALLAYIGYFTEQHFSRSLGWPLCLMLMGFVLIGLSAAAFRIHRRFIAPPDTSPALRPGKRSS